MTLLSSRVWTLLVSHAFAIAAALAARLCQHPDGVEPLLWHDCDDLEGMRSMAIRATVSRPYVAASMPFT